MTKSENEVVKIGGVKRLLFEIVKMGITSAVAAAEPGDTTVGYAGYFPGSPAFQVVFGIYRKGCNAVGLGNQVIDVPPPGFPFP